jgi:hypothetical protein
MSAARSRRALAAVAALALAAVLSGCENAPLVRTPPVVVTPDTQAQTATATPNIPVEPRLKELAAFRAALTAGEAVPPANSAARGELVAVLNRNTGLFRWKLTFTGMSGPVRGAHFHGPAASGEVARALLPVGGSSIKSPYEGRAMLSARQIDTLLAGQWYVNLRSASFPEGELRGQLVEQQ